MPRGICRDSGSSRRLFCDLGIYDLAEPRCAPPGTPGLTGLRHGTPGLCHGTGLIGRGLAELCCAPPSFLDPPGLASLDPSHCLAGCLAAGCIAPVRPARLLGAARCSTLPAAPLGGRYLIFETGFPLYLVS